MAKFHDFLPLQLPKELLGGWQAAADIMAEVLTVPVGLLTRLQGKNLEVLVASRTEENPFGAGKKMDIIGSGSYPEEVIRIRGFLKVQNARKSEAWKASPMAKEGFVAYLGLPLLLPGGHIFGTICVLDRRPRTFKKIHESLLFRFKDLVEAQLSIVLLNRDRRERVRLLSTYREELAQLREAFPICPSCKRIRNDSEYWDAVEEYFVSHAMGEFGHGLCPDCSEEHWGETILPPEPVPLPRGLGSGGPAKA